MVRPFLLLFFKLLISYENLLIFIWNGFVFNITVLTFSKWYFTKFLLIYPFFIWICVTVFSVSWFSYENLWISYEMFCFWHNWWVFQMTFHLNSCLLSFLFSYENMLWCIQFPDEIQMNVILMWKFFLEKSGMG